MEKRKDLSKRKKLLISLMIAFVVLISVSFTFAWFTDRKQLESSLRFGKIALDVTGSSIQEENLVFNVDRKVIAYQTGGKIMPGDTISIDMNVGLKETSQDAYYIIKLTDELGIFQNSMYFADGTKDSGGNIIVYQTNGTKSWVQGDTSNIVSKKVGKISNSERHPISLKAVISGKDTGNDMKNAETKIKCDVYAIQQKNLTEAQAAIELLQHLPTGYMKVETISAKNDSTSGFNNGFSTGISWSDVGKIDVSMQLKSGSASKPIFFSSLNGSTISAPYVCTEDSSGITFNTITGTASPSYKKSELTEKGIKDITLTINSNSNPNKIYFGSWSDNIWSVGWDLSKLVIYGKSGEILKSFVPSVRSQDGAVGVFEAISGTFVKNFNANSSFTAGEFELSGDYKKVDYIQSTAGQWIDTGVKSSPSLGMEMDVELLYPSSDQKFFGSYDNGIFLGALGGKWRYGQSCTYNDVAINSKTKVTLKNGVWKFNGVTGTTIQPSATNTNTIPVFAVKYSGNAISDYANIKLYGLVMYDGDKVIRNFVPCVNSKTNQAGLFDLANKKFYTNQKDGDDFTVSGSEIPQNYKQVDYIESSGLQSIDTGVAISTSVTDFDMSMQILWTNNTKRQLMGFSGTSGGYFGVNCDFYEQSANEKSAVPTNMSYYANVVYSRKAKDTCRVDGSLVMERPGHDSYSGNLRLFSLNKDYTCYMRLKSCQIKVAGSLVRDFVPVVNTLNNNKPGLYDKVNKKFYVNEISGADFTTDLIPSNYSTVSYIESTGAQILETGYTPNSSTRVEADVSFNDVSITNAIFCSRDTYDTNSFTMFLYSGSFRADYGNKQILTTGLKPAINTRYKISFAVKNVSVNGQIFAINGENLTVGGSPMKLFASHGTYSSSSGYGNLDNYAKMKLYSFKIYEGETLMRDFVPVYDKTNKKAGLWDTVTKNFYTTTTSTAFNYA